MIKRFISLEWKQFIRSAYFKQGLVIKILLIFTVLYFALSFAILGGAAYFIIEETFPGKDPLIIVSNFLIYWFLFDLVYRYFIQKMPVMNVLPLMSLPIKRENILHYLLGKTGISVFNILPLFFFVPFSIVLLVKGYSPLSVIPWFLAMVLMELVINYLNLLINKSNKFFYPIIVLLLGLAAAEYYDFYDVTGTAGIVFNRFHEAPYAFLIPGLLLVILYRKNFQFLRSQFYLDSGLTGEHKEVKTSELSWLNRFGDTAAFLKNDIRMIWRNKRPKQVMLTSFIFLFYGLLFFTQDMYRENFAIIAFASIFVTGGFLLSFGQLVPSWDSEYYKLLMSQNIPYRKYLESKWYLMVFATALSFLLSIPYVYFGWEIFGMIAAGAIFNIGLNSFITLWGGALNRIPVELNVKAKAFSNTQGFNMTQMLIALPKMVLPVLLFFIPYLLFNYQAGIITLALGGILGLVFKNFFLNKIENTYQKGKYKTVAAFGEKQ